LHLAGFLSTLNYDARNRELKMFTSPDPQPIVKLHCSLFYIKMKFCLSLKYSNIILDLHKYRSNEHISPTAMRSHLVPPNDAIQQTVPHFIQTRSVFVLRSDIHNINKHLRHTQTHTLLWWKWRPTGRLTQFPTHILCHVTVTVRSYAADWTWPCTSAGPTLSYSSCLNKTTFSCRTNVAIVNSLPPLNRCDCRRSAEWARLTQW